MIKFVLGAIVMFVLMSLWRRREAPGPTPPGESPRFEEASMSSDIEALVRQGQKIQAIKAYRIQTGCGLKEAKEAVDALERRLGL